MRANRSDSHRRDFNPIDIWRKLWSQWPALLCMLLLLAGRSSLADHYIVPSGSMEPTLVPGDRVVADKTAYGVRLPFIRLALSAGETPRAGEVAIFDSPADGQRLIKRIVAVPGDRVEMHNGLLAINHELLADSSGQPVEVFGARRARLDLRHGGGPDIQPHRVPEGRVLVLGDARGNSRDSRFFGLVDIDDLYARAIGVFFRKDEGFVWRPL